MMEALQIREVFHIEFLRWMSRKVKSQYYAVKGGSNMRFFFHSYRYSEDMDIDIAELPVKKLSDISMEIFKSISFGNNMKPFGIEDIIPPDIVKAKQTETTQRFKVHLRTAAGVDIFTKIEFSRRGLKKGIAVQSISDIIMRNYKLPPLLIPHYTIQSAIVQKIEALAARSIIQARDIFDLYILHTQSEPFDPREYDLTEERILGAYDNLLEIDFHQFRDTVIPYLVLEDRDKYETEFYWEKLRLKVAEFIDELRKHYV